MVIKMMMPEGKYKDEEGLPDCVKLWLGRFTSKETIYTYRKAVDRFEKYLGRPVEQFIEERQKAWHDPIQFSKSDGIVNSFFTWLRKRGGRNGKPLSPNSAYSFYIGMRSLCKANGVRCGEIPRGFKKNNIYEQNWYPTQEQITLLVDSAKTWRDKALITTMKDSGARVSLIAGLKVKDVLEQIYTGWVLTTIKLDEDRMNLGFKGADVFVCGTEACEYIRKMIEEREAWGEPLDGESWLFRSYASAVLINGKDKSGKMRTKPIKRNTPSRKLHTNSIQKMVVTIGRRSGLVEAGKHKRSKLHTHSFRKFFYNRLIAGRVPDIVREYLMNHAISATRKAYFNTSHEGRREILEQYKDAYPNLSIKNPETNRIKVMSEEITDLKTELKVERERWQITSVNLQNENEQLHQRLNNLTQRRAEIDGPMSLLLDDPDVKALLLSKLTRLYKEGKLK